MKTLRQLLDQGGTPPPEICVDWAWQLVALDPIAQPFPADPRSGELPPPTEHPLSSELSGPPAAWDALCIDDQGHLSWVDAYRPRARSNRDMKFSLTPCLQQLLTWAHAAGEQGAAEEASTVATNAQLAQLTLRFASREVTPPAAHSAPTAHSFPSRRSAPRPHSAAPAHSASLANSAAPAQLVKPRRSARRRTSRTARFPWPNRLRWPAWCVLLPVVAGAIVFNRSGDNRARPLRREATFSALPRGSTPAPQPAAEFPFESPSSASSSSAESSTALSGADQRSVTDSRQDQAAPGSLPTPAIIASGDGHRASIPQRSEAWPQEGEVAALPANQRLAGFQSTGFLSTGFQSAGSQSAGSPSLESPPLELQAEAIDVLAEVEQWTRAAAQQQGEQLLTNDSGRLPGLAPSEPLRLATYPMWQLQRVALPTRLRRPWWSLRLQAGKGLVVQPEQAQPLSERGTARWLVYAEQAVAPVTRVVVQAEQARHRAGSLRWRVAATADDLPLVVVPLGLEHVRQLQDNLRGGAGRLQLEIDRLRRLSRADGGLPRGMRSAVRAQRRNLETQHQLSLRLLEIVADAGQITGWLDGQFQVHAELRDEALPSGEPLLQFGQVLLGPTAAVELPAAESSPAASLATESIAAESGPVTAGGSAEGVAVEAK